MRNNKNIQLRFLVLSFIVALAASSAFGAATITILNNDGAGEGFNDPTPAAPVGGNPGTTVGQQRLNVFNQAAATWGATLSSNVTIVIRAQFDPLPCSSDSGVLGGAGSISIFGNFPNAPFQSTWYGGALADKLAGSDRRPGNPDINATFNSSLGQTGCLDGSFFYYGYDGNEGTNTDLYVVMLHEFAHGLGFQTFTSGSSGTPNQSFFSIYDRFLVDDSTGLSWLQMTDGQRAASALGTSQLAWNGPQVTANVPTVLGSPVVKINSPAGIAGNFVGVPADFGPSLTMAGVTANVVQALDPADGAGALTTDGCSALTNAAAVSGKIAIIDRGTCLFTVKVKNAQDAGAIAVIIANSAAAPPTGLSGSDTTITIPLELVLQADGNSIKAQLTNGVNATLKVDPSVAAGFDSFAKALMYSPNPYEGGSSVSHWDTTAFPNQLMEPNINFDLTHTVVVPTDLTFAQLSDIGWVASTLPNSIVKSSGDNQTAPVNLSFGTPFNVTIGPIAGGLPVTWTVNSAAGAGATFPSTGTRVATTTTNASGVATAPTLTANATTGAYSMNATIPGAGTATFSLTNGAAVGPTPTPTVSIIVQTNAAGRSFTVDGTAYTAAQNFTWTSGSLHTLATTTPQQTTGARYDWSNWSNGGAISHSVMPTVSTTYTANFTVMPTGANVTVSGRILTSDLRGLRNASVSMTDVNGVSRTATTSSFGFFSFSDVATGQTYTFRVSSRLFRFSPQTVTVNDDLTLPDFVGLE